VVKGDKFNEKGKTYEHQILQEASTLMVLEE
jgi:hypothetical protein